MLNRKDIPFLVALAAIAFALFLNIGVSFAEAPPPNSNASSQVNQSSEAKPPPEVREARATEVIADYTRKLAWLTGVLAFVGIATSGLALWQILLARAEFNATHRPQLEVFFVRVVGGGVEITVINTGTSDAKFIAARAILMNLQPEQRLPSPHDIVTGDFDLRGRFSPSDSDRVVVRHHADDFAAGFGGHLQIFGWIIYESAAPHPIRRTTYFGRRTELAGDQLVPIEASDWNLIR